MSFIELLTELAAREALPAPEERRRIREAVGVSKNRAGRAVGVTGQTIAYWETGARQPRGDRLVKYVGLLAELVALPGESGQP